MHIVDILGLISIFVFIGFVGYRSSKKVKNIDDFTVAGGHLGKLQTAFSMAATEFGGSSLVGAMALTYTIGIAGAWWDWSAVPAFLLLGIFFAGKIKMPNLVTITDFFEMRYDYKTKILASAMHIIAIITQISTQFMVGATVLNGILGIPKGVGVALTVFFVTIYTMSGGLVSVVNTDVVQFVIIVLSLVIAMPIALYHAGGITGLQAALPAEFFSFGNIDKGTVISWCLFCFFTYATSQHYIQRVFAAKDKKTARFAFLFTGFGYLIYGLVVAIIGICIVVLLPNLSDPNVGYTLFIKNYVPIGLAGIILGGIFAASMSTADSMLLAASTLFVHDIYQPLISKKPNTKGDLKAIRIVTVVVCLFAMCISLFMDNIVTIMYIGGLFYSTAVFFPLIIGMRWKGATARAAFVSIIAAVVVGCLAEFGFTKGVLPLPSNVLSASTSLIVFMAISLGDKILKRE